MKKLMRSNAHMPFRGLHLFANKVSELAIVNNSGLFFTVQSLKDHGREEHPNLHVAIPEFWLDNTLSEYDDLDWGQTAFGLPWYVRNKFLEIFPRHSKNDYIKWGQYKKLRESAIRELEHMGIPVSFGIPTIVTEDTILKIMTREKTFSMPRSACHVYNSFRTPNTEHGLAVLENKIYRRSHSILYGRSRSELLQKSFVLLGVGRSTIWLAKHFPNNFVACIGKQDPKELLLPGEEFPENLSYYSHERMGVDYEMTPVPGENGEVVIQEKDTGRIVVGEFYCSIGLTAWPKVSQMVPKNNLTVYPAEFSNISSDFNQWVGPTDIPVGSLIEATLRWAHITNNLHWAHECFSYHPATTINFIVNRFEQEGVSLSYQFFNNLSLCLKDEMKLSSLQCLIGVYQAAYKKTYEDFSQKDIRNIAKILEKIDCEREKIFFAQTQVASDSGAEISNILKRN